MEGNRVSLWVLRVSVTARADTGCFTIRGYFEEFKILLGTPDFVTLYLPPAQRSRFMLFEHLTQLLFNSKYAILYCPIFRRHPKNGHGGFAFRLSEKMRFEWGSSRSQRETWPSPKDVHFFEIHHFQLEKSKIDRSACHFGCKNHTWRTCNQKFCHHPECQRI